MSAGGREGWCLRRGESGYPQALLDLGATAPEALHGRGREAIVRDLAPSGAVTIVGARRASGYGIGVAEELGRMCAAAGLVVVSGMARGIDAAAHRGALAAGGATVAVLGGGPDVVYPPGERRLYGQIAEHGALVSEMVPGTPLAAWSFPRRNRIMAALAELTVVVEAAERSGSLITARLAADIGRTVGAVPGPVNAWLSRGPNQLIVDGAPPIRDAQDVLDRLVGVGARSVHGAGPELEAALVAVLSAVEGGEGACDAIAAHTGAEPREVAVALARLELLGYVTADPGGRYARTALAAPAEA